MDNFNYQAYIKSGKIHGKKAILTELKQVSEKEEKLEELEIPTSTVTKVNSEVTNIKTMAQAMLDFFNQVKEKEAMDFESNANMKVVLAKLNTLAKTEEKEEVAEDARTDAEEEGYEDGFKDAKADMKDAMSKMKVSELKAKIREDILSTLTEEEEVDVDVDVEDEVEVDAEADDIEIERKGVKAKVEVGLSPEEEIVQDSLKAAMDAAQALGSDKLADQIGNTITFFTRQFVVGDSTD